MNKTNTVTVRMTPETVAAAQRVASLTYRSLSSLTEYALNLYLLKNYPLAFNADARVVLRLDSAPTDGEQA